MKLTNLCENREYLSEEDLDDLIIAYGDSVHIEDGKTSATKRLKSLKQIPPSYFAECVSLTITNVLIETLDGLPSSVKELFLYDCKNFHSIATQTNLDDLHIGYCEKLKRSTYNKRALLILNCTRLGLFRLSIFQIMLTAYHLLVRLDPLTQLNQVLRTST